MFHSKHNKRPYVRRATEGTILISTEIILEESGKILTKQLYNNLRLYKSNSRIFLRSNDAISQVLLTL